MPVADRRLDFREFAKVMIRPYLAVSEVKKELDLSTLVSDAQMKHLPFSLQWPIDSVFQPCPEEDLYILLFSYLKRYGMTCAVERLRHLVRSSKKIFSWALLVDEVARLPLSTKEQICAACVSISELQTKEYMAQFSEQMFLKSRNGVAIDEFTTWAYQRVVNIRTASSELAGSSPVRAGDIEMLKTRRTMRVPTGLPELDRHLGGLPVGTVTVIMGNPKVMKTWLLIYIAKSAWEEGYNVVFASREMDAVHIQSRLIQMCTGLSADQLDAYSLDAANPPDPEVAKKVEEYRQTVASRASFLEILPPRRVRTVDRLQQELMRLKMTNQMPHLLIVDNAPDLAENIGKQGRVDTPYHALFDELKLIAQEYVLPIILVWHVKSEFSRKDEPLPLGALSYAKAGEYDVDLALGLRAGPLQMAPGSNRPITRMLKMNVAAVRYDSPMDHEFELLWDFRNWNVTKIADGIDVQNVIDGCGADLYGD